MDSMNCTVCNKEMHSEINEKECAMCGMSIETKKLQKIFDERLCYFCCNTCLEKYGTIHNN